MLRAGWPDALWVAATVIKVTTNTGGYSLELIDPGPKGAQAGQLRVFLPAAALPEIRRELGVDFAPAQLVDLETIACIAPGFDPKWGLQGRLTRLAKSMQASLAARLVEEVRSRLRREGLFDRQRRLPRLLDVTRVVVIHPPGSAGLADIERELWAWQRAGLIHPRFAATSFDGPGAAARLADAVRRAAEPVAGHTPDLVLLVRGGGARNGLLTLDDDALARAIATLPVPVVCGLGHASDWSLADDVCHLSTHTPSKALGLLRDLIHEPARRTLADRASIDMLAGARLDGALSELSALQERMLTGAERTLAATNVDLVACWAEHRTRIAEVRANIDNVAAELDRKCEQATAGLPAALAHAAADAERLLHVICVATRRNVERAPDPAPPLAAVLGRGTTLVTAAERESDRLMDAVVTGVHRHLDRCDAALRQAETGLADLDHTGVLARGYLLARDADGTVLTTRKAALGARTFTLHFGDGTLAVVAVDPQPASPTRTHP